MNTNSGTINVLYLSGAKEKVGERSTDFFSGRVKSSLMMILADTISFSVAAFFALLVRVLFHGGWRFDLYPQMIPVMLVCMCFYGFVGLYPALGLSAVAELKKIVTSTSVVALAFAAMTFWFRNAEDYSRQTLALTWLSSLFFVPLGRDLVRVIGARLNIWGESVAIVGYGKQGQWALEYFLHNRSLGLKPSVIMDFSGRGGIVFDHKDIQVLASEEVMAERHLAKLAGVETALIIVSDVPTDFVNFLTNNEQGGFKRLILIPNLEQISSYGVNTFDFGGVLGLEVRHNLLDMGQQTAKRAMDIGIVLIGGLLVSPILGLAWLILKLDSTADVFFSQLRIGIGGREFSAWKFRTMVPDAEFKVEGVLGEQSVGAGRVAGQS